ncbi:hypothetical protein LCGC14_2355040 [marine sediment metagenome]|uniref:Uncharacterized protein n=1 Tax=marine sediment metagenome TaxID=412755 RepID=A0A0F9CVL2_9ZZZZ
MEKEEAKAKETEAEDNPAEDKPTKEEQKEKAPSTQKSEDIISKANTAAARIEEATKELTVQLDRQEAMKVEETLGGKTEAGQGKVEITPEEYAKKVMANDIETTTT